MSKVSEGWVVRHLGEEPQHSGLRELEWLQEPGWLQASLSAGHIIMQAAPSRHRSSGMDSAERLHLPTGEGSPHWRAAMSRGEGSSSPIRRRN